MALYCTGYDTHAVFNGDLLPTPGYCNLGDLKKIKTVTSKDTIPENCKLQWYAIHGAGWLRDIRYYWFCAVSSNAIDAELRKQLQIKALRVLMPHLPKRMTPIQMQRNRTHRCPAKIPAVNPPLEKFQRTSSLRTESPPNWGTHLESPPEEELGRRCGVGLMPLAVKLLLRHRSQPRFRS